MDLAVMIEGQAGLSWAYWRQLATQTEQLGFAGLYRSDHLTEPQPPNLDALETWVSLTWLASHTKRIEFGPLVSPVSFRDPINMARTAAAIDDLSGGRLRLGIGAGWQQREHAMFGYDLLDTKARMARFAEALEVVSSLLQSDVPVSFDGSFYNLHDAILLPRPQRAGGPPIVIGGNGPKYTLPLVARFAQEWNAVFVTAARFRELQSQLDELLAAHRRAPGDLRRTLMTGLVFGRTTSEVRERALAAGGEPEQLRERGMIVGTADEAVEQLHTLAELGVQRVMLQWFEWDNPAGLEAIAAALVPHFPAGNS